MFVGLALVIILGITLAVLAVKILKGLFRLFTGERRTPQERAPEKEQKAEEPQTERQKKEVRREAEPEEKAETRTEEVEPVSEELKSRYAEHLATGITENEWVNEAAVDLSPSSLESLCVEQSRITHLEFSNRKLAGEEFYGFNLIIETDRKMTLTYNGQAVASITKIEVAATAVINGEEVSGTAPGYRINTFPPNLKPGMVPSDLQRMIDAAERIQACSGNPERAQDVMLSEFCSPDNISKLKNSIDRKIQQNESGLRQLKAAGKNIKPARS